MHDGPLSGLLSPGRFRGTNGILLGYVVASGLALASVGLYIGSGAGDASRIELSLLVLSMAIMFYLSLLNVAGE
jgi:hypothetical protein